LVRCYYRKPRRQQEGRRAPKVPKATRRKKGTKGSKEVTSAATYLVEIPPQQSELEDGQTLVTSTSLAQGISQVFSAIAIEAS
jgi:hypothetical protein